jgi:hypothetical protein
LNWPIMATELPLGQDRGEPVHGGPEDDGNLHGIAGAKRAAAWPSAMIAIDD